MTDQEYEQAQILKQKIAAIDSQQNALRKLPAFDYQREFPASTPELVAIAQPILDKANTDFQAALVDHKEAADQEFSSLGKEGEA